MCFPNHERTTTNAFTYRPVTSSLNFHQLIPVSPIISVTSYLNFHFLGPVSPIIPVFGMKTKYTSMVPDCRSNRPEIPVGNEADQIARHSRRWSLIDQSQPNFYPVHGTLEIIPNFQSKFKETHVPYLGASRNSFVRVWEVTSKYSAGPLRMMFKLLWLEWDAIKNEDIIKLSLKPSEKVLDQLEDVGQQLAVTFSHDGSLLAVGGEVEPILHMF
ncbi:hypothetical protein L6452_43870 [Arctium lappa]|uniref:Uncharacterized protein n=1 Tax=Arctium lappa TaxID=4217 RepID=A0ACB8XF93_ARCLA|nr:hypothetical protein L6452_43870 [Arctium lappa]